MCVSYQLNLPFKDIAKTFKAKPLKILWDPSKQDRIRPSHVVPIIMVDPTTGERVIKTMIWGMPYFDFIKKKLIRHHLFNAKAETITEKKTFKTNFQKNRILVPVNPAFIEWKDVGGKKKQPYLIGLKPKTPFAFAGIWGKWNLTIEDDKTLEAKFKVNPKYDPPKKDFEFYTVITTTPNELVGEIHNRMPVILEPKNYDAWLADYSKESAQPKQASRLEASTQAGPKEPDLSFLKSLLKPYPAAKMQAKAVAKI